VRPRSTLLLRLPSSGTNPMTVVASPQRLRLSSCESSLSLSCDGNSSAPSACSKVQTHRWPFLRASVLVPLADDQPPPLLVAEIKFRNGGGFGRLLIGHLNSPEVLPALANDRDAPASQLGGGGFLFFGAFMSRLLLGVYEYTPFCNGPVDVNCSPIVTPPSSRFCPWFGA
jgi:hypothetical protein